MIPPTFFGIPSPLTGGCSESLGAFRFSFKNKIAHHVVVVRIKSCMVTVS